MELLKKKKNQEEEEEVLSPVITLPASRQHI
jgi:hypothetical protein